MLHGFANLTEGLLALGSFFLLLALISSASARSAL